MDRQVRPDANLRNVPIKDASGPVPNNDAWSKAFGLRRESNVRPEGGCAACGSDTQKRAVSPFEDVSAMFCDECEHIVTVLNGLVDAARTTAQPALQTNTLRRLRRVDQVVGELIRRRMVSILLSKGNWDDISEALGMAPDEAKARYPMPNSRPKWGWGDNSEV